MTEATERGDLEPAVWRARHGDLAAFEEIYRATAGRVFALCRRLAGDAAAAEDLTQEAYLRAWTRLGLYEPGTRFESWLLRVAANVVLSDRRARRLRQGREEMGDDLASWPDPAPRSAPAERLDLEAALRRLPPGARAVYVLHEVEGFSHEEIGDLMGISAGTSKAQLHRSRRLLREALRP